MGLDVGVVWFGAGGGGGGAVLLLIVRCWKHVAVVGGCESWPASGVVVWCVVLM